jgi:endonuclease-3 related protein
MKKLPLVKVAEILQETYGDPKWWPADTPFEVGVGAILTQNTNWKNVEKAIQNLKFRNLLHPRGIVEVDLSTLRELIRPAGYFVQKGDRLKRFSRFWLENLGEDPRALPPESWSTPSLREALLKIRGIGPESADSILLYAFSRLSFVVDAYTVRFLFRLNHLDPPFSYDEIKQYCEENLPRDLLLWNRIHAQIVVHGKTRCFKRNPLCDGCPFLNHCRGPQEEWE